MNVNTKVIIDTEAVLEFVNAIPGNASKMSQKDLADNTGISEQSLINWKNKAPKVASDVLKIQAATGAPLETIIKEVAK